MHKKAPTMFYNFFSRLMAALWIIISGIAASESSSSDVKTFQILSDEEALKSFPTIRTDSTFSLGPIYIEPKFNPVWQNMPENLRSALDAHMACQGMATLPIPVTVKRVVDQPVIETHDMVFGYKPQDGIPSPAQKKKIKIVRQNIVVDTVARDTCGNQLKNCTFTLYEFVTSSPFPNNYHPNIFMETYKGMRAEKTGLFPLNVFIESKDFSMPKDKFLGTDKSLKDFFHDLETKMKHFIKIQPAN